MKKRLPLLLALLLCGCSQNAPQPTEPAAIPAAIMETAPIRMYDPDHPLEMAYHGALKVYPLTTQKTQGIRTMGEEILTFSGYGSTTLTLLTGKELTLSASRTLDFPLSCDDPSLQISESGLSYYDPIQQQLLFLNQELQELRRLDLPAETLGSPILSQDQTEVYYCTSSAILCWDLQTGIHRTLKELSYDQQTLTGLHWEDTVLQCQIHDGDAIHTLFLDTESGRLLHQLDGDVSLTTKDGAFYAALPVSSMELLVYGEAEQEQRILYPEDLAAQNFYLPEERLLITASILENDRTQLTGYALDSGTQAVQLTLDTLQTVRSIAPGKDGCVFLLVHDPDSDCDILYRWETASAIFAPEDRSRASYSMLYSETKTQDPLSLAQCQDYAARLSAKYGINILVWEDALAVQPWDYEFEAETFPQILSQELTLLDRRLQQYPAAVLEKTASHFSSLNLCLVRQITGTAASGSLEAATGVQFLEGSDAYVVIAVGKYSQQALYHELFHVMETHILNESSALDQWNELNPEGFVYSFGYDLPETADQYLSGENQAFVDRYSMSFPKEDRARVFESAMLPGNRELFSKQTMQAKLAALCEGIRKAYGLRKAPEDFPWEQYLTTSMAYTE